MPQRQGFSGAAQQDFLVGHQSGQPDAVDRDVVHPGPPRAFQGLGRRVGTRSIQTGLGTRLRDHFRGSPGCPRGRIDLVGVMQLDDFHGLEIACGGRRKTHHQDCADAEIGRDEDAETRLFLQPAADGFEPLGRPAGGADHRMHTGVDTPAHVVQHDIGRGEINNDVRLAQRRPVVTDICRAGEHQIGCALDRAYDLRAHPTLGAEDADPQGHATARVSRWPSTGPITASERGPANTSPATSAMSSAVTASILAIRSAADRCSPYTSSPLPRRLIRDPVSSRPSNRPPVS